MDPSDQGSADPRCGCLWSIDHQYTFDLSERDGRNTERCESSYPSGQGVLDGGLFSPRNYDLLVSRQHYIRWFTRRREH